MEKETEISNKTKNTAQETSIVQDIVQLLLKIAFIVLVVFLIFTFLYGIVRINDVSMKPAIKDGDLVMYYRLDKRFISGDVAVFENDGRITCGRVVAVAGDTVDITKNGLKINDCLLYTSCPGLMWNQDEQPYGFAGVRRLFEALKGCFENK